MHKGQIFLKKGISQETKEQPRGNKKSERISILKSKKEGISRPGEEDKSDSVYDSVNITSGIRNLCELRKVGFVNVGTKVILQEVQQ